MQFRTAQGARHGITEEMYEHVASYRDDPQYAPTERLAIEYAERFALHHDDIDDEFFDRLREHFSDAEILDLTVSIGTFLALGRTLTVLGLSPSCDLTDREQGDAT